jgi:DNA-binding phage protein
MTKTAKSNQQKKPGTKPLTTPRSFKEFKNSKLVSETLLDCIRTEDLDSFRSILISCLTTVNKTHFAKSAGIGRATLYDMIDSKKSFNPELSTVAAIIRALAHEGVCTHA